MSQSLAPGDFGLFQQTTWYDIKCPPAVFCFSNLSLVPVPCWVGSASARDRHPLEKSLRSSLRRRHSFHPSCLFPGEHLYFSWTNVLFAKNCYFREEKKKLKMFLPPLKMIDFFTKLFWFCFTVRQFLFHFGNSPPNCILHFTKKNIGTK